MSILALPMSLDDLELAWLKESYAEGYGKKGKAIASRNMLPNPNVTDITSYGFNATHTTATAVGGKLEVTVPPGSSGDSFALVVADAGAMRLGMKAGRTYTLSAVIDVSAGFTDFAPNARRQLTLFYKAPSIHPTNYQIAKSNQIAPGSSGFASVTVTLPADTTEAFVRLYCGSATVGDKVTFSQLQLEEKASPSAFFSGATADNNVFTYDWEGAANNSSSIKWSKEPVIAENLVKSVSNDALAPLAGNVVNTLSVDDIELTRGGAVDIGIGVGKTSTNGYAVIPNTTYYAEAIRSFTLSGYLCELRIQWYDAAGASISTSTVASKNSIANQEILLRGSIVSPADAAFARTIHFTFACPDNQPSKVKNVYFGKENVGWFPRKDSTGIFGQSSAVLVDVNARDNNFIEKNYWEKLSGLVPANQYSFADHKLAALRANVKTVAGDPLTVTQKNYAVNPGGKSTGMLWSLRGGATTPIDGTVAYDVVAPWAQSGTAFRINGSATTTYQFVEAGFLPWNNAPFDSAILDNKKLFISYLIKSNKARNVCIRVRGIGGDTLSNPVAVPADTPTLVSGLFDRGVIGTGAAVSVFYADGTVPFAAGDYVELSDALITEATASVTFFDANTNTKARWTGSANNSISELVDPNKNTVGELWISYLMSRSGLTGKFALHEHELAFYKSQLGL